jgi:hypothetical protein
MFVNPSESSRYKNLPCIFHDNYDLLHRFHNFCADNHHVLSSETTQNYLLQTGIPALIKSIKFLHKDVSLVTIKEVLKYYGMKYLCTHAVLNWVNQLGYI